ncbi:MAG: hypothetical protein IPK82_38345 [Polyangiaceae bacterium]|nr:hypothetical protein [Polyangiaceae bacterium]
MTLSAGEDLSMILPLPVPQSTPEGAVTFIDLSAYAEFFDDIAKGFPEPVAVGHAPRRALPPERAAPLAVVEVGSFEASFVPSLSDFDRLDPRFRLPADAGAKLPGHERSGFAVFKLMKGKKRIHPMAFTFPRAAPGALFFPTVHIHDGQVHAEANFDHALFLQRSPRAQTAIPHGWQFSNNARYFVNIEKARGMVDGDRPIHRLRLKGRASNRDIYVED